MPGQETITACFAQHAARGRAVSGDDDEQNEDVLQLTHDFISNLA
jgi:hypothetical protein